MRNITENLSLSKYYSHFPFLSTDLRIVYMTQELQSPSLLLDSLRQVTKTRPRLCSKARIPEGAQVGPVHMSLVLITGEICVYKVLWKSLSIWTVGDVIKNSLS